MIAQSRQLLHGYTSRRSPWGPPWWIYGAAFGALNLIRQVAVIVTSTQIPPAVGVATWVTTALVVIVVINSVAVALQRRGDAAQPGGTRTLVPLWPLRRGGERSQQPQEQAATSTKWAPWWVYVVIIVGADYVRRAVVGGGGVPAARVVVGLAQAATLFVIITVVHRAHARREGTHR